MLRRTPLLAGLVALAMPCALAGLGVLAAPPAFAQGAARWSRGPTQRPSNWHVQAGLLPDATIERLQRRYPWIDDADELEDLLRDIGRRHATTRLEAYEQDGIWVIRGERAPLIADITIDAVSRVLRTPLYAAVQAYLGQVDSPGLRTKVEETMKALLRRRGYPLAQIAARSARTDEGLELSYTIREGDPCVVSRVEIGFQLPKRVKLEVAPGDLCDRDVVQEAVSRLEEELRELGYNQLKIELRELEFDPDTNTAAVYLSGVLGQRVRYEVVDESKTFLIGDILSDEELTKVDPTIVGPDAMAAELARRYRNKGFLDIEVDGPKVRKSSDDEFVYVYKVTPGREYKLRSIRFEGDTVFDEDELLETMDLGQILTLDVDRSPSFNPEEVGNGINRLRARYQQAGYWDAKIRDPGGGQRDRDTASVRMTIQIEAGPQRILRDVRVDGARAIPARELRELLATVDGTPLDRGKLVDFQQDIRTAYLNKGYLYAQVEIELATDEPDAAVTADQPSRRPPKIIQTSIVVKVKEGPRVRIGDIAVTGLVRTDPKVVRRELIFETGDWYEPERITQSRQALTRLGIFRSVQILPADRNAVESQSAELDLVVDVREAKAGNVSFGPGWSLRKGWSYGAEATYSNIGGTGRQVSMRGSISEERHQQAIGNKTLLGRRLGAGYTEPWILDLPVDLQVKASQEAEWGGELWELSFGGEVALQHKLRELLPEATVSVFYGQEVARTEGPPEKENELVADDVRIGTMGLRFDIDRRDDVKFPTDGFTFDSELAWARYALGGDLKYFRWRVSPAVFIGLLDDLTLAFGLDLSSYEDIERKSGYGVLPPTERRKVGLGDQVRGYRAGTLGPIVLSPEYGTGTDGSCNVSFDKSYLGGNRRTVIKSELRHKLNGEFAVTGFVDNGNVFFTSGQASRFASAYAVPVAPPTDVAACAATTPVARRVEDNVGYDYGDLLAKPGYIWSYHYWSYGAALNVLTPVGAINFAYGLPWREPKTEACSQDAGRCFPRAKQDGYWLLRGELNINVGARF